MIVRDEIDRLLRDDLNLEPPEPDSDLIATGLLDSLGIVRLLVELEHRFGITVPLSGLDLEAIRTIERLEVLITRSGSAGQDDGSAAEGRRLTARAAAVRPAAGEDAPSPAWRGRILGGRPAPDLLRIKHGVGRPLFLMPGSWGGPPRALAGLIDTPRPIYGLQALRFADLEAPPREVEALASSYLAAIRSVQPRGPYALGGFSFGGLVAYEMAHQLTDAQETVDVLLLIDPQTDAGALSRTERWRFRLASPWRYARHVVASPRTRIPLYLRNVGARLRGRSRVPERELQPPPPEMARLAELAEAAEAAYRPPAYPGDAVLFLAGERSPRKCNPHRVWGRLVQGRLEVVDVGGAHLGLLLDNAPALGAQVSHWMAGR